MLKKISIIIWFCCIFAAKPVFSQCSTQLNGIDSLYSPGNPFILTFFNDSDTLLYFAGGFVNVNTTLENNVSSWDGDTFHIFNQGLTSAGLIKSLIVYKGELYMGGGFNEVDNQPGTENLAIWDGLNWSGCPIGEPLGGDVYDMIIYHDTLFICGGFWCFGSTANVYRDIIATDGTNWFHVGDIGWPWVSSLFVYNDELYLGGYYGMKKYLGGTSWEDVVAGPTNFVADMDVDTFNNFLYVGGSFFYTGSMYTNSAAMYDGFEWHSMSTDLFGDVYEQGVKFYHGAAYYCGDFDTLANGLDVNYVARWNGSQWEKTSCKLNAEVAALEVFRDTLFIGGYFYASDGTPADGIVKYFAPDTGCAYMQPLVQVYSDTFKINDQQPTTEVQFFNNNAYADTWQWDFDDGGASANTKDASHIFDTPGTYTVSVTVSHNACIKTATRDIVIIDNTGIEGYTKVSLQFKLFPNPTSGAVSVECTLPQDRTGEIRTHLPNGGYKNSYKLQGGFNHVDIPETDISKGLSMVSLFVEGVFVFSEKVVRE